MKQFTAWALALCILAALAACSNPAGGGPPPPGSPRNPIPRTESGSLSGSGWADLLAEIAATGDYVALDLSGCSMSGTEFDPDNTNSTGKSFIVSLVLPDAATSVKAGTYTGDVPFSYFTNLASVTGTAIITVGYLAFYGCDALKTVSLPAATTIGGWAFGLCSALETLNLPTVTNIGDYAFYYCKALTSVHIPENLTSIGDNPFSVCPALTNITVAAANPNYKAENGMLLSKDGKTLIAWPTAAGAVVLNAVTSIGNGAFWGSAVSSVNLPAATSIGNDAFWSCYGLVSADFPAATSIGHDAFTSCYNLSSVNLPAATSISSNAFRGTHGTLLTVTLGSAVPTLASSIFVDIDTAKNVTVKVPSDAAAWNGKTGTFTTDTTSDNWGNGFRGGGWNGSAMTGSTNVNTNINLTIDTYVP
jgi:hypothetical protein